ncbi:hypothetical protein [Halostella sp. PRR32]|uniref:DUF7114 family protein n=1 Tax=Halostella sp. PRR32 TaxID=3098147 RepID=UPI002B1D3CCF|nr:hypothetical protein [Halostella sp. PRR32]
MEEAATCRRAAREAVRDIEPDRLHDVIDDHVGEASMTPGALALLSARAADENIDFASISNRAAGVQLIYDGLRLTRTLARTEPWAESDDHTEPNLDVLAADVLVSRGFYLLARTDAADKAVATVQAFGRDQTRRRAPDADAPALDGSLERNVLELAVIAGTSAVGVTPSAATLDTAAALADGRGSSFSSAEAVLPDSPGALGIEATATDGSGTDSVPKSASDR